MGDNLPEDEVRGGWARSVAAKSLPAFRQGLLQGVLMFTPEEIRKS